MCICARVYVWMCACMRVWICILYAYVCVLGVSHSVCLSVCLSVYLPAEVSTCLCQIFLIPLVARPPHYLCICVYLFMHLSLCMPLRFRSSLFVCLSVCLSVSPLVHILYATTTCWQPFWCSASPSSFAFPMGRMHNIAYLMHTPSLLCQRRVRSSGCIVIRRSATETGRYIGHISCNEQQTNLDRQTDRRTDTDQQTEGRQTQT